MKREIRRKFPENISKKDEYLITTRLNATITDIDCDVEYILDGAAFAIMNDTENRYEKVFVKAHNEAGEIITFSSTSNGFNDSLENIINIFGDLPGQIIFIKRKIKSSKTKYYFYDCEYAGQYE